MPRTNYQLGSADAYHKVIWKRQSNHRTENSPTRPKIILQSLVKYKSHLRKFGTRHNKVVCCYLISDMVFP